jgi:hypothetical protein
VRLGSFIHSSSKAESLGPLKRAINGKRVDAKSLLIKALGEYKVNAPRRVPVN